MNSPFRLGDFRPDPRQDVRDELEAHLELEAEALEAQGMTREEAYRAARKRLGDRKTIEGRALRYAARGRRRRLLAGQLDTLRQDVRYAVRTVLRARGGTALILLLLALGIGVNTALFSTLKGVFLEPLTLPDAHELVFLWETTPEAPVSPAAFANYMDWKEQSRALPDMGAYLARHVNLTDGGDPTRIRGALAAASLFRVLGVDPALGRPLLDEEDFSGSAVVVLDHRLWQGRYGADPDLVGKSVDVDGIPHVVLGIMPEGFFHPDPWSLEPIQLWMPLPPGTQLEPRHSHSFQVLGRLGDGVTLQQARTDLEQVALGLAEAFPDANRDAGIRAEPVHEVLFGEAGHQILLILAFAALVLLIACGNIASLQIARAARRKGEVAVRGALGGSRGRILRQLLTENLLLAGVGGVSGLLVAWGTLGVLRRVIPPNIPRADQIGLDGPVFLFALVVSLGVGLLVGMAPAFAASRVRLMDTLKDGRRGGGGGGRSSGLHRLFPVGQFALTLVLANGALLLFQSFGTLRQNELGFQAEQVLTMNLSLRGSGYSVVRGRAEFYDELLPRIKALPGVREVGASTSLPLMAGSNSRVVTEEEWAGSPEGGGRLVDSDRVAGSYFSALGVPLLSGRFFIRGEDDSVLGDDRAILNRAAAETLWPGENPLGKRFSFDSDSPRWITVLGVVGNIRNQGLGLASTPEVYLPYASFPTGMMFLTVKTESDPLALAAAVREEIRSVDPLQAVSQVLTLEQVVQGHLARREFYTTLTGVFAALALLLAAVGVYGVLSHHVVSRTHEIGLRMALGSGKNEILVLMVRKALVLAGAGVSLGLIGVFLSRELLQSFLYGVGSVDPGTLTAGACLLLTAALVAAYLPARWASRVNPVQALKGE